MTPPAILRNALTIDVEDYFQVSAFAPHIARADWPRLECRIEANIERILLLLESRRIHATFFTLGWIAERYPAMLRRVAEAGHEVASHGYAHLRASEQSAAQFADDVCHSKTILEQLTGLAVRGYRAPSFSIGATNLWAFDVLQEAGYRYSSSIYPIRHDHYGMPDSPRYAWRPRGPHGVLELPVSTVRLRGRNLPAGGGGYFRLLPYALSRWLLRRINSCDGQAGIFYFHPWELDPGQPRPPGLSMKTRFRHYLNLGRMEARLTRLTADFAWDRMDRIFLEST
ncbi:MULTISPECIES: XrtA system polysaccharide deacetylase [unclassified Janthinobacterium]|uniref:XrtA system polysaccharide deacetylase n=1 Tax=unclassified Janthinobacterium TaxID=2610881 RepID=UPI0018C9B910|nr:XrtA system polysaccharide deacetylase [Janthinobacterium sp. CG_23.4]MDH6158003.1 polysaccharide deacetylase family protein (PEP-CTERM system associated) [Janthinobacterium sp. CG_23.4]